MTRYEPPPEGYVDAPAYLQVRPERRWGTAVSGAAVVGVTQKRPNVQQRDTLLVKVTLRLPKRAFDPLQPEAVVVVPADLTEAAPLVVEASDPADGAT